MQALVLGEDSHLRLGRTISVSQTARHIRNGKLPHIRAQTKGFTVCVKNKYRKLYQESLTRAKVVGHIHADTKGKIENESSDGHSFFVIIVEKMVKYTHVIPVRSKGEASREVLNFMKRSEKHTADTVRSFHTKNGSEFKKSYYVLASDGIEKTTTTLYIPASN